MNTLLNAVEQKTKKWWMSLLAGICAITLGIWSACTPGTTLIALTFVFIVSFLVSGITDIIYSVSNREEDGWGWVLTGGIMDLLFGIILWAMPLGVVTIVLIYLIGFWIMFRCLWAIGIAASIKKIHKGGNWLLALGILGLVLSVVYFLSPSFSGGVVVFLVSTAFIIYGIFRIVFAFAVKEINSEVKEYLKD